MQFTPVEVVFVQCVTLRQTTLSVGQVVTSPIRVKLIHQIKSLYSSSKIACDAIRNITKVKSQELG